MSSSGSSAMLTYCETVDFVSRNLAARSFWVVPRRSRQARNQRQQQANGRGEIGRQLLDRVAWFGLGPRLVGEGAPGEQDNVRRTKLGVQYRQESRVLVWRGEIAEPDGDARRTAHLEVAGEGGQRVGAPAGEEELMTPHRPGAGAGLGDG